MKVREVINVIVTRNIESLASCSLIRSSEPSQTEHEDQTGENQYIIITGLAIVNQTEVVSLQSAGLIKNMSSGPALASSYRQRFYIN